MRTERIEQTGCQHEPRCPAALGPGRLAARLVVSHPEQGWSLLCNGIVVFEDTGALLPGGATVPPTALALAVAA